MEFTKEQIIEKAEEYAEKYLDYGNHKYGFIAGFEKALELILNEEINKQQNNERIYTEAN